MLQVATRLLAGTVLALTAIQAGGRVQTDVCVYGGTSAGVVAAVHAARLGRSVVVIEPGRHLGGLSSGGLGATDIGNKAAIGGISREFYRRVARHYVRDDAWRQQHREEYFSPRAGGQARASSLTGADATMWTFEPHVAEDIFFDMVNEVGVPVYLEQQLEAVVIADRRIREIRTSQGKVYAAAMFIDATYEGDLLAKAGVSFTVGREANRLYGETLNGIRAETPHHQFTVPVDPYVRPGDPSSGLLPFIQPGDGGIPGEGDHRVQAYNYRLCFTTNASNRLPVAPPPGYDASRYELLGRYLEALVAAGKTPRLAEFWNPIWMPNHKTDINNNGGFSTDYIGMSWDYAEATPARRREIERDHEHYIRGFFTYLVTSPRVPESMRVEAATWGMAADEFLDTGGWPNQLYVREARRMVAAVVMTEHHCRGKEVVADSVGLAAYNMDSHNCQRVVKGKRVENEGDVQVAPMKPYAISYRAIIPKASECGNLLVPVCLSSSHIAYGSIRMEPVFMILAQSAATAAVQAIRENQAVQDVPYPQLRAQLLREGQILEWGADFPATRP